MTQEAFKEWWHNEGSQAPYKHHDCEEHTMRMCEIAWANGAYKEREALAKEKTLQALHSENERLGLYKDAYAQPEQDLSALVTGMEVSIDVSTGEHDSTHRLFGVVDLVQQSQGSKHGLILLVQETKANFKEALAKEKTLQALHSENERLGLYKDAYAQPNTITFHNSNADWVMRITVDSRIEVNEDVEVTEAAQKVLDAMQYLLKAQRTWVGLTEEEIKTICVENGWDSSWQSMRFAHAIEAKLKQKNGFAKEKNT